MPLQAVQERTEIPYREPFAVLPPEELLKQLIDQITSHAKGSTSRQWRIADHADEIIFEADINGTHYYVVCDHPSSSSQVSLSPRELVIARLIAKGLPNKSISDLLDISPYTVATHLRRIFVKLGVSSRAAMVARLVEERFL